jgi:putative Mg2+ transporter-C (MgtC) family protein
MQAPREPRNCNKAETLKDCGEGSAGSAPQGGAGVAWLDIAIRLGLALLLGSAIGFERQWHQRMAGLRTNALVALGAASFVAFGAMQGMPGDGMARVAAQVVSGIGFLGAGVILHQGVTILGLNTAATLWCSAAIGVFAGGGYLLAAAIVAAFIIATNSLLRPLVRIINRQPLSAPETDAHYRATVICRHADEAHVRALMLSSIETGGLSLRRLGSTNNAGDAVEVSASLALPKRNDVVLEKIVGRLSLEPAVTAADWHFEGQSE